MTYLIISVILMAAELAYFKLADRFNIIDKPNLRSSHTTITLRGGGIVFYFGAMAYFIVSHGAYPWFMLGLTMIAAVSFVDDLHSMPNRIRLMVQFIAMLLMFHQLGFLTLESWWISIAALIVCTEIINAYNFMDGINGITGAYSIAILIPLAIVNSRIGFIDRSMIYIIGISVLVFCIFNFRKRARCFAGDVGSVSIAFILLFMLGALIMATGQVWYLIFFAVYGVDSVLTIIHRLMLHENIFKPHRKHAYQIMANELGMPHTLVSTIYFALQTTISLGALYLHINEWVYFISVIAVLSTGYTVFQRKYFHLHLEYLKSKNKL